MKAPRRFMIEVWTRKVGLWVTWGADQGDKRDGKRALFIQGVGWIGPEPTAHKHAEEIKTADPEAVVKIKRVDSLMKRRQRNRRAE